MFRCGETHTIIILREREGLCVKIKRDQLTGLALILLGVVFAYFISQFKTPFTPSYPGPALLPGIGVFGLIVCGAGVFVNGCRQKDADTVFLHKDGWIRVLVSFVVLCLYVLAMKYLGYLIVTPFLLYGLTTYFAKASGVVTKLWVRIVFSIVVSFAIWAMYVPLFGMTLPAGLLFE